MGKKVPITFHRNEISKIWIEQIYHATYDH